MSLMERRPRRAWLGVVLAGVLACAHGAMTDPAWLDGAFVSFRYARRLSEHGTLALVGSTVAVEGFDNPLWTALLSAAGWLGVHEFRVQAFLGPMVFGLLSSLVTFGVVVRVSRLEALVVPALFVLSSPLALAAASGTDGLFVALLALGALLSVLADFDRGVPTTRSGVLLALLTLSGCVPTLFAIGLGLACWRKWLAFVWGALAVLTGARWLIFGVVLPHGFADKLSSFKLDNFASLFQGVSGFVGLGFLALLFSLFAVRAQSLEMKTKRAQLWPIAFALLTWVVAAVFGEGRAFDFGSALVPVLAMGGLALALAINGAKKPAVFAVFVALSLAFIDTVPGFMARQNITHGRMSTFKRARHMARFLRWRFSDEHLVVTQTAGILPYLLKRPTFDLSGTTHTQAVDIDSVLAKKAEAMIPVGRIVSVNAERLGMSPDWDWREVAKTHNQHALQFNPGWGFKGKRGLWFNLYMDKNLPKFLPGWDALKKPMP